MLKRAFQIIFFATSCAALFAVRAEAQVPLHDPLGYLKAHGVAASEDTVQAAWMERAWGSDEHFVYGFRILDEQDAPQDLYFDADTGAALDKAAQLARGILPKPVTPAVASHDAEVVLTEAPKKKPAPKSLAFLGSLPEIALIPVDRVRYLAEDAQRNAFERGALRLGVVEDLPEPVARATFQKSARKAGSARALILRAPGALGLRLHFTLQSTNAANALRVYDPAQPMETYAPAPGDTEWWSPTCWSEAAVIECDDALEGDFLLDRAVQVYRQPGETVEKFAGACEVDVSCQEHWRETALGVGGLGTISEKDFIFCTCSLLVDANTSTAVPYLLTANHCVSSASEASPLEVYWLYETSGCGAPAPDISAAPRTTGGANFLAGNANYFGTDFTLLRLRNTPPSGLTWLGWETVSPGLGASIVGIHHPDGDFKRISFGDLIDRGADRLRPAGRYHEVRWHAGVTEPGSSGSPLFLASTQRIVGQLYGGTSSCRASSDPDYYGRFDVSYLSIQQYLGVIPNPFDVNGDKVINAADMQQVVNAALDRPLSAREDLDGDGLVGATDIQLAIIAVLSFSR